jgi:branched-chain amino acid transport system substrate-binding protein
VLAPGFLVDDNLQWVLAEATGTRGVGAGGARLVELDDARVGPFSIGYTSERLARADVEDAGAAGGELLTDEHGRPLEVVYGVVSRDRLEAPLDAEDLRTARAQALQSYRRFLADEGGHHADTSAGFALQTRGRPREAGVSSSAPAGATAGGSQPDRQRRRPWRSGHGAVLAIAIAIALAAGGVILLLLWPGSRQVTVYSSLPLQGPERKRSQDMVLGMRLALKQAGGKAGKFDVTYVSLDDSTAAARGWTPQQVRRNASRAAKDGSTAAYIGEFDSAASAVSIPILSGSKVPQISPSNTAVGLTTNEPGAAQGEPDKLYAGGFRNYVRIVPRDTFQGAALATVMREDGCRRTALLHGPELGVAGVARTIRRSMSQQGLRRVLDAPVESTSPVDLRALANRVADQKADCVVVSASADDRAVQTLVALDRALGSRERLYGSDGVFTDVNRGELPQSVAARLKLVTPALGPEGLGAAGRRFFRQFAQEYPADRNPDPNTIYAYEAMRLALDAIDRAGTDDRESIVKALFDTEDRHSVIGTYSIDDNGDTTLAPYGLFKIEHGAPRFIRTIQTHGS